ncbi:conjugative transposon protein TraM [Riemerella anatipestifer]|uniref:Conjugative transposon protein TraM n=4 Tax=Weeksellaceae TaxID=2762318 RepID=A0AAP3AL57_RIEAN|nr:conjugative transposon protein TraM [Riemerella anatipestifer]MBO4232995.1 conjugative transposon protein TraM [Riemerella anatipestifer]MCW0490418.1 conjugative transposon protein TraM [Riemerella anatipestifer]MCW0523963.1 conjugative transposon protein TraM [Riemerella anatipestifer]MDR7795748.1 conjugative transposon protein TraM [Riemerella anatipestifer]MDY3362783.1 conjugative transposon protein TraM [Riemerella anatipestifer]
MEENKTNQEEPEKYNVLLTDEKQQAQEEQSEAQREETRKQLKKWLIFALMGLVFLGCMYLLFFMGNASDDKLKVEQDLIPEPAEISLPEDKGQAYEQDLLEQKRKEKQMAMQSLGDFSQSVPPEDDPINASMTSYQKVHRNLDDFYREDSDEEKKQMQEEIDQLKKQLTAPKPQDPLETQMKLMERSYQLANKYSLQQDKPEISDETSETKANDNAYIGSDKEAHITPVYSVSNKVVSQLPRALSDEKSLENWVQQNQRGFHSMESQKEEQPILKNSIKACIHTEQRIDKNNRIPLRLLEPIRVAGMVLPKGTLLTAMAKIDEGRLLLDISSLEYQGRIVPVSVTAYDLDGQRGLYIPYTPGANAFREIAAGLSQSSGTNYTFSSSAKDQILSEAGKGLLQGTSSYISKKIAHPKIKVKAGYQVLLVSKP